MQCRRPWFDSWVRKIHWRRDRLLTPDFLGFPCGSTGKESSGNAGDLGSIPGLGWSPGVGKGYPLQNSWVSLVAQLVKNPQAMRETWVLSLDWEDPLEKGTATHSSILAWRIPLDCIVHGFTKSQTWLRDFHFLYFFFFGMVLVTASCTMLWTSIHSSSDILSTRHNPLNLFIISTIQS